MQAIYAWYSTKESPERVYDLNLKDTGEQITAIERKAGDNGDFRLLSTLFYQSIENQTPFDELIQKKAENWELERIALLDRILMQMAICEMLNFPEIPIKVTINEYLEIAKKYSTPKSSKFINGILDSLYAEFKETGKIQKSGRGLIETSVPKKKFGGPRRKKRRRRVGEPKKGGNRFGGGQNRGGEGGQRRYEGGENRYQSNRDERPPRENRRRREDDDDRPNQDRPGRPLPPSNDPPKE